MDNCCCRSACDNRKNEIEVIEPEKKPAQVLDRFKQTNRKHTM